MKTYLYAGASVALILFITWYSNMLIDSGIARCESDHKSETIKQLEDASKKVDNLIRERNELQVSLNQMAEALYAKREVETVYETINVEIEKVVTDNPVCDYGVDAIKLFNDAIKANTGKAESIHTTGPSG